jgi:hypothetical protein
VGASAAFIFFEAGFFFLDAEEAEAFFVLDFFFEEAGDFFAGTAFLTTGWAVGAAGAGAGSGAGTATGSAFCVGRGMEDSESLGLSVDWDGVLGDRLIRPELSRIIPAKEWENPIVKRRAKVAWRNFMEFSIDFESFESSRLSPFCFVRRITR